MNWSEPATQPTLSTSSVNMGNAVTISTPAASSSYTHRLRYAFGSASGTIATDVAASASWTPPVSLAAQIPNAVSGSGTIYCDTYSGSTLLGTKSVAIKLTVPSSVVPSAGTLTASVSDDTSGTGLYVKGMGKARVQLTGSAGAQGSTIKSTKITGGGWTENDADMTTGTLTTAGEIVFTATVTDSRGRTASTTCTIQVLDYSKPGITSYNVYRCDETGAKKNNGTYAAVEISAFFSEITGNALTLTADYKLSTDTDYGSAVDLTNGGKTVIGDGDLSSSKTYDIRITVADKYNEITRIYPLSTRSVMRSILKNLGIAFGKVAELIGWMDVAFHLRCRQDLKVDGTATAAKVIVIPVSGNNYPGIGLYTSDGEPAGGLNTRTADRRVYITNHCPDTDYYEQFLTPAPTAERTAHGYYSLLTSRDAVTVAQGGTGAKTAAEARSNLGAAAASHTHTAADLNPSGSYTDWTLLTLSSAFTAYGSLDENKPRYKAYGNVVTVRGILSPATAFTSSTEFVTMATGIPSALRPKIRQSFICQGSGYNRWQCSIGTDGSISMSRYGTTAAATVPTDAWLIFSCTYII